MQPIPVYVSANLVMPETRVPQGLRDWFDLDLMVTDDTRQINLLLQDEGDLILPRGYAEKLVTRASELGIEIEFEDQRVRAEEWPLAWLRPIVMQAGQQQAVDDLIERQQGIWEAPPGAGKTVGVLEGIRRTRQRFLVVVNTTNIAQQWRERIQTFLPGIEVGVLGDGDWREGTITIALVQSLWRATKEGRLKNGFFERWGGVCVDEAHHTPAETYLQVISRFPGVYRWGVSATPDRGDDLFDAAKAMLGEVVHVTKRAELQAAGILVRPFVKRVETGFSAVYWGDHAVDRKGKCKVPGCKKNGTSHSHRNNYAQVCNTLLESPARNKLIASKVIAEARAGHACLILSKRLAHLDILYDIVSEDIERCFMLTGRETTDERMMVYREADKGECAVFSTLADEALDIPRLDRAFLTWPTKATYLIKQQIGRVSRRHPNKRDAVIWDFTDKVGPMRVQWSDRAREVYKAENIKVVQV